MNRSATLSLLSALLVMSCKHSGQHFLKSDEAQALFAKPECQGGQTQQTISLQALAAIPKATAVAFGDDRKYELASPSLKYRARIDLCSDEQSETFEIKKIFLLLPPNMSPLRVIVVDPSISSPQANGDVDRIPPANLTTKGLAEAIFGEVQHLEINVDTGHRNYQIKGWQGQQSAFVTASEMMNNDAGKFVPMTTQLVAGGIDFVDVFSNRKCPDDQQEGAAQFELGSAKFEMEFCSFLPGGETSGYKVLSASVQDSDPQLDAEQQDKFTFAGDKLGDVFAFKFNHHNMCDSFVFKLPHATYSATTSNSQGGGCTGTALKGAPEHSQQGQNPDFVMFRHVYKDGHVVEQSRKDCYHFFTFCR
ncbi:MAG: hypothetical protein AB7T49_07250 [Oligoflexales bacterium]